ncbi:hypothetical protein QOZ88_14420 [Blastococcus sp. BMG 814]|uniref:Secreted protein n=1 Tax=Blastococcus carthaginiensis TaxID=3050034 RepID=A0ABT9IE18_9ACTN|nr:hypothetical protein [Blastococcus carthaginiensis]MDP5183831.1 hypothetical protein [Blastococcus carthaginiensis]
MSWVLIFITVWVVVALVAAIAIGAVVRLADHEAQAARDRSVYPDTWPDLHPADVALPHPAFPADEGPWRVPGRTTAEPPPRRGRQPGRPAVQRPVPPAERAPSDREAGLA